MKLIKGLFLISIMLFTLNNSAQGAQTESIVRVASGGSTYKYILDIPSTFQEDIEYEVQLILSVVAFGDSISDFHDIFVYIQAKNGETLVFEAKTEGILEEGEISKAGSSFFKKWRFTPNSGYPESIDIYVSSIFKEDKSGSSDPQTNDAWVKMTTITKTSPSDDSLNFPIEYSLLALVPTLYFLKRSRFNK